MVCRIRFLLTIASVSWTVPLSAAPNSASIGATAEERWQMTVGGTRTLETPLDKSLRVSRRGIIDFAPIDESHWSIAALQRGTVSVSWGAGDNVPGKRLLIEVLPRPEATSKVTRSESSSQLWDQACAHLKNLTCNRQLNRLEGETDDWQELLQARRECRQNPQCWFAGRLGTVGKQNFTAAIQEALGKDYRITSSAQAHLQIWHGCLAMEADGFKTRTKSLLATLVGEDDFTFSCFELWPNQAYKLGAKVLLIDESTAQELGLLPSWNVAIPLYGSTGQTSLLAKLQDLEERHLITTVGEPVLRLDSGTKTRLTSGGEIQTTTGVTHHSDKEESSQKGAFKRFGIELVAKVTPTESETVRLSYDITLSHRVSNQGDRLQIHSTSLAGDLLLAKDKPTLVGGTLLNSEEESTTASGILGKIPFLAPLFQVSGHGETKKRAYIWFLVSQDAGEAPETLSLSKSFPAHP